jgi:hypothetical protein
MVYATDPSAKVLLVQSVYFAVQGHVSSLEPEFESWHLV